ncbi:MAG: ComEC/Rec2 family competence protein [Treponema sp.]
MHKKGIAPVIVIALSALVTCYGCFALLTCGVIRYAHVRAYLLCAALLMGAAWVCAVLCIRHKQLQCSQYQQAAGQSFLKNIWFMFFALVGAALGCSAAVNTYVQRKPPYTLARIATIRGITAECIAEPVAAGADCYQVPVRLIACDDTTGAQFSASGTVTVQLPAALVRSGYAGSITGMDTGVEKRKVRNYLLIGRHGMKEGPSHIDRCRFYAQGMRFFVRGKFDDAGTHFVARPEYPIFLGWESALVRVRAFLRFYLMRMLYAWGEAGGLLLALLSADKAFLSSRCLEQFRQAGLSHVLALSGMHVTLISAAAFQSTALVSGKKWALSVAIGAVVLFVWFAGASPSLFRALIMMLVASIGRAMSVQTSLFSVLCAAMSLHLGISGADAFTLGFMLSYGACAGIILFGEAMSLLLSGMLPPLLLQSIAASIGAQLFTFPIIMGSIGSMACAGVIASCVVSPLISGFFMLGLFGIPVALVFPVCIPYAALVFNLLYKSILFLTQFFAGFPAIQFENPIVGIGVAFCIFLIGPSMMLAAWVRAKSTAFLRL